MLSWIRTKINLCISRVIIPRLEVLLVWYLKSTGQRNVEKYWRKQLATRVVGASGKPVDDSSSVNATRTSATSFDIRVATVWEHSSKVQEISYMINAAYVRELKDALLSADKEAEAAFSRTTPVDIERRLLTDDELRQLKSQAGPCIINRVLFLAVSKDGTIVGTCAATLSAPWCPPGVGSWGLLAVATPRSGVGRALVEHCEQYIRTAMLEGIGIEYFFVAGLPSSDALRKWYEDRLGYQCFKAPSTGKSYRGNEVRGEVAFRHCKKGLDLSKDLESERAASPSEKEIIESRKQALARFLLAGTKSD